MKKQITIALILLLTALSTQSLHAQKKSEKAYDLMNQAVSLMDEGKLDESVDLIEEAIKLAPDNMGFKYELALARTHQERYKDAIKILEEIEPFSDKTDQYYQLLGNNYDMNGQADKALKVYDAGLKKYPKSGKLFLEKGNVYYIQEKYNEALSEYEKGIEADPNFPSNYYRAAIIYNASSEKVWAVMDAETLMNLERNSKRTQEMSKMIYDIYKSQIKFESDTSMSISMSKNATITPEDIKAGKMPFGVGVYEPTLLLSIVSFKQMDLPNMVKMRTDFIKEYYKYGNDKKYDIPILKYQKKVLDAGHMEAYSYWILMMGDEATFAVWQTGHKDQWDKFVSWFKSNAMEI